MQAGRDKAHTRNMTPNFLRFKKKSVGKREGSLEPHEQVDNRGSERSSSKASKCSFEVYEKRVLNLSKLSKYVVYAENTLNVKRRDDEKGNQTKNKMAKHEQEKRTSSNDKPNDYVNYVERQNLVFVPQRLTGNFLSRKRSSGSGNLIRPKSRQRLSNPKRNEQSLDREEERAKLQNTELLNNLMKHQHLPNYINKLKIKKEETLERQAKKSSNNLVLKPKRRFFEDPSIEMKTEQALSKYELHGELGKGAYGIVRMAIDTTTKQKYAVKIYEKARLDEPNKIKNIQRQVSILSRLSHPVISKLIETIETPTELYLIMEYGGANSLYKFLLSKQEHRLSEQEAKSFLKTILSAVDYLHRNNIVHRDIKAENILLNRYKQLKLIDFGFSLFSKPPDTIDTFCGTPTYMAPEIVSKKDHIPIYTDMWSIGILYYVMVQGNYPFRSKNQNQLFQKIRRGQYEYIHEDISDRSKTLIKGLLQVNPLHRFTVQDLLSTQWVDWYDNL